MNRTAFLIFISFIFTTISCTQNFWPQTNGTHSGTGNVFARSYGSIVDTDGVSKVNKRVGSGNYYLVIRHRNHLRVMSSNATMINKQVDAI